MLLAVLVLALAPTAPMPPAKDTAMIDPLAPSRQGQVQCYRPNLERKTCASIGAYVVDAKGAIQNTVSAMLAVSPQIVMTTIAPVTVKAGAICGWIRPRDLQTATFTIDGQPASAEDATTIRGQIGPGYKAIMNHEICSVEIADADGTIATVRVDGDRRAELDMRVRWISPKDGFVVGP